MRRNRTAILPLARFPRWRDAVNFILMKIQPQGTHGKTATVVGLVVLGMVLVLRPGFVRAANSISHGSVWRLFLMHFDSPEFGFADYSNLNGGDLELSIPPPVFTAANITLYGRGGGCKRELWFPLDRV